MSSRTTLRAVALCSVLWTAAAKTQVAHTMHYHQWPLTQGAQLDFTQGAQAVPVEVPVIWDEPCVVGCDKSTGQLLFAGADGVYDREGTLLAGTYGEIYCVAAMPHPGDEDLWYLFGYTNVTLSYWVFDRRLRNGLGDMTDVRNVPLLDIPIDVKLIGLSADDGSVYRLWAHEPNTDHFKQFTITAEEGLNPQWTSVPIGATIDWKAGYSLPNSASVRPDNRRIALAGRWGEGEDDRIWLVDVDPNAGTVTNTLEIPLGIESITGARSAFSPNGQLLYVPTLNCADECGEIRQYDLTQQTPDAIVGSAHDLYDIVASSPSMYLQLGPDGVIYSTSGADHYYLDHVLRILSPDEMGWACGWDSVGLMMPVSAIASFAMPWTFWPQVNSTGMAGTGSDTEGLLIGPNPCSSMTRITWPKEVMQPTAMRILDASGRLVASYPLSGSSWAIAVDISNLAVGSYTALLQTSRGVLCAPLLIAH